MIVSHKYRFIFVKTRKTAGTSIEIYLSQHCGPADIVTPIIPHVEPHLPRNHDGFCNHLPAAEIRRRLGPDLWHSYYKFCVERNPWDKTLSQYHMKNVRSGGQLSFDQFLAEGQFAVDHPLYTEPGNPDQLIVDRVLRYERLTEELGEVFAQLGVPFQGTLGVQAKSEYRTDRRPYREVYSLAQAEIVRQAFARELAIFGYSY